MIDRPQGTIDIDGLVSRVRQEFLEVPGLCLTTAQAARLWGVDRCASEEIIDVLVRSAFLRRVPGGAVVRCR